MLKDIIKNKNKKKKLKRWHELTCQTYSSGYKIEITL
jgi:hypothetical protein